MANPIRSTSFSLTPDDVERLNYIQRHTGTPKSTLVRSLLRAAAAGVPIPGCPALPPLESAVAEMKQMGIFEEDEVNASD